MQTQDATRKEGKKTLTKRCCDSMCKPLRQNPLQLRKPNPRVTYRPKITEKDF